MPDGEGVPHLVDLQTPANEEIEEALRNRNGAHNAYWLYTRSNPSVPQILVHGDANSVRNSNYVASRPLKVLVHGWNSDGNSAINRLNVPAFLQAGDANVIVLDWNEVANSLTYVISVMGVPSVGQHLGHFLVWLIGVGGGNWNNIHLVGFSLGAHVVGHAGRAIGGLPGRITGLDPAGPLFGGSSNALNANDGQYVETIHTDGDVLGIFDPLGNANFYPNGGTNRQPGCLINTCSHSRAYELFASSVQFNHLVGRQCSNLNDAREGRCNGNQLHMGNSIMSKRGNGIFGLTTGRSFPF